MRRAARSATASAARVLDARSTVAAGGAARQLVTLPVPTVTIYPGEMIDADELTDHLLQSSIGAGIRRPVDILVGKVAKRTLLPGEPDPDNAVGEVDLVTRGTSVQLVFQQAGLIITAYASPLEDGSAGDLIRVRNIDSGATIIGMVQPDGTVRVGAPCMPSASPLCACTSRLRAGDAGRGVGPHQGHRVAAGRSRQPDRRLRAGDRSEGNGRQPAQLALHRAVAAIDARQHGHQRARTSAPHAQRRRRDRDSRAAALRRQGRAHRRHRLIARRRDVAARRHAGDDVDDGRRRRDLCRGAGASIASPVFPPKATPRA